MARSRATSKPNIVVIWGDDIGMTNLSCYSDGLMGYRTPNIDRIAQEGMRFTDCYGEQSCTAGRSSFITGQHGLRTGLTKVGLPAATVGLHKEDPTIAELRKIPWVRIIRQFRLFLGVQVIEIAVKLVEAVHRRQIFVAVAEVVLAYLRGCIA